jgi:hypothetical protein
MSKLSIFCQLFPIDSSEAYTSEIEVNLRLNSDSPL